MLEVPAFLRRPSLSRHLLTETENTIIGDILELLNKHGLTSHQSMNLLQRLGGIIEMGSRWRRGRRTNKEADAGSMHINWKTSS